MVLHNYSALGTGNQITYESQNQNPENKSILTKELTDQENITRTEELRIMNTKENLPELSHLQFAVLEVLGTALMSGKDLRTGLIELGIKKSGPTFYQMMARMEDAKLVDGSYSQQIIDGQIIKERQYKVTGNGIRALNQTKKFYHGKTHEMALSPAYY